jgi:hypothetical protein
VSTMSFYANRDDQSVWFHRVQIIVSVYGLPGAL